MLHMLLVFAVNFAACVIACDVVAAAASVVADLTAACDFACAAGVCCCCCCMFVAAYDIVACVVLATIRTCFVAAWVETIL